MNKVITVIVAVLMIMVSCRKENINENINEYDSLILSNDQIVIRTFSGSSVYFEMKGKGIAIIDWGDGRRSLSQLLDITDEVYGYLFLPENKLAYTITITGNVTVFECQNPAKLDISNNTALTKLVCQGGLTELDVSKNIALTHLECIGYNYYNRGLTNLDVSNNTALTYLNISNNRFTTTALNALFESLHNNPVPEEKVMRVSMDYENQYADLSIAEKKGWTVYVCW